MPPQLPDSCSNKEINKNMEEAKNHFNPVWFKNQVRNKQPWDSKQKGPGPNYQNFGNFNYGAAGYAMGFPDFVLVRMAGWAQQEAGTSKPNWGDPFGKPPYGDDPDDQIQINLGIQYSRCGCR